MSTCQKTPLYLVVMLIALLSGCGDKDKPTALQQASINTTAAEENELLITETQFKAAGMQLGSLRQHSFSERFQLSGSFDVPPQARADVSALYGGYVTDIRLLPGQQVSKGQPLLRLENPEFIIMQQEFLEVASKLAVLKAAFERQSVLSEENITAKKNFLQAKSEYETAQVRYEALKKQLALLHINAASLQAGNIRSSIQLYAPIGGYVTNISAFQGKYLTPSDVALSIVNTEHLHLELNAFEGDLPKLKEGQTVWFKPAGTDTMAYKATVYLISKDVDEASRMVKVHAHLANEQLNQRFLPGQYLEAEVVSKEDTAPALPEEALLKQDQGYVVLIRSGQENGRYHFTPQAVEVGRIQNGMAEIKTQFAPETRFLIKGSFGLLSE